MSGPRRASIGCCAARIRRVASMPSTTGIERSIRTTSGASRAPRARPPRRRPRPRRPPRCRPAPESSSSRPARTSAWSSTTSTRITCRCLELASASRALARSRSAAGHPRRCARSESMRRPKWPLLAIGERRGRTPGRRPRRPGSRPRCATQREPPACSASECATTLRIASWATRKNRVSSSSGRERSGGTSSTVWIPRASMPATSVRERRAEPGAVQARRVDLDQEAAKVADALPQSGRPSRASALRRAVATSPSRAAAAAERVGRRRQGPARRRRGGPGRSAAAPCPRRRSPAAAAPRARAGHGAGGAPATRRAAAAAAASTSSAPISAGASVDQTPAARRVDRARSGGRSRRAADRRRAPESAGRPRGARRVPRSKRFSGRERSVSLGLGVAVREAASARRR